MPTDKKVPLTTRVRPGSKLVVRPATQPAGLDTGLPPTDALLEGAATQAIEPVETPAWDPRKPSRPPRTDAESIDRERVLREGNPIDHTPRVPPARSPHLGLFGVAAGDYIDRMPKEPAHDFDVPDDTHPYSHSNPR